MNPRELIACAEAAMMTAKARGKSQSVLFDDSATERPLPGHPDRDDVRSIAHLKMLQSLAGKLNRLNDVRRIGEVIVTELRLLVDYHNCRVYVRDNDDLVPVAFQGDLGPYSEESVEALWCKVGEGFTGHVAATGESLLLANAEDCEFAVTIPGTDEIDESVIAVPLKYGPRVIGVVVISKLGVDQFDEDDVRLLEVLAGHASVAVENARLYEAERTEAQNAKGSLEIAEALLEFSRQVASADGLEEVLDRTVELSARTLGAQRASVWLQEHEGGLVVRALWGYEAAERERVLRLRFEDRVARRFLERVEPFELSPEEIGAIEGAGPHAGTAPVAVAPIRLDNGRLGCIAVRAEAGETSFSERKMRLLAGIAHQARLALANASSFQSLEDTFLSTVEALANALEANDEYTSSHARWITDMSLQVGRELGLDTKALKRLELGALFHDIGKIGIPASILSKPGPLTDDERKIVQLHPELGAKILAPIERLEDVCNIVSHCHEHYDGSGYPHGKAGSAIPIESRVILVCDAFHAMTTDRPYRKRLSLIEARRRLEESAGTQFDPNVVEVFLRLGPAELVEDAA